MAQRQKHWVQAMLNEDTYVAVPVLLRRDGLEPAAAVRRPGRLLRGRADAARAVVPAVADARADGARHAPRIGVFRMSDVTRGVESGRLAALAARPRWDAAVPRRDGRDIAAGGLDGADVLLVPDGYAMRDPDFPDDPYGLAISARRAGGDPRLGRGGGRYVGWLDGAVLAAGAGVSSATFEHAEAPASSRRAR